MGEVNRIEIGEKLKEMGDYVKMGYLSDCLKRSLDFDTKKFVLLKLSEIYEAKKMFVQAGKMMENAAGINTNYRGKMNDFVKAGEYFVKGGDFEKADVVFNKAIGYGGEGDKREIRERKIEFLRVHADLCFKKDKRNNALITYEKLWSLNLLDDERIEVREKLLVLYEKLGKIKEYSNLKKNVS